jgi:hypothetical protein
MRLNSIGERTAGLAVLVIAFTKPIHQVRKAWDRHALHGGSESARKATDMYRVADVCPCHKGKPEFTVNLAVG